MPRKKSTKQAKSTGSRSAANAAAANAAASATAADIPAANDLAALEARVFTDYETQQWLPCIEHCKQVLRLSQNHHVVLEMLATAYLHLGDTANALATMQKLLLLSPRDPLHRLKLAALLQMQGELGEAMIEFTRVAQLYPGTIFMQEAEEAIDVLDRLQIQQVLTRAAEQYEFGLLLQRDMEAALENNSYHLSEGGHETLRQMVWDGRVEIQSEPTAPRVH